MHVLLNACVKELRNKLANPEIGNIAALDYMRRVVALENQLRRFERNGEKLIAELQQRD